MKATTDTWPTWSARWDSREDTSHLPHTQKVPEGPGDGSFRRPHPQTPPRCRGAGPTPSSFLSVAPGKRLPGLFWNIPQSTRGEASPSPAQRRFDSAAPASGTASGDSAFQASGRGRDTRTRPAHLPGRDAERTGQSERYRAAGPPCQDTGHMGTRSSVSPNPLCL